MATTHTMHQSNGHQRATRKASSSSSASSSARNDLWASATRQAKNALESLDVPNVVKKYPLPALAVAGSAGILVGVTVGSKLVRMLVSSVGMYTVSELMRKYAKSALDEMQGVEHDHSPIETD